MKNLKTASLLASLALAAAMAGCAATPERQSTGEFVDDAVITTKVKARLVDDLQLKGFEIKVDTFKGVVQLSGTVSSQYNVDQALADASQVQGVVSVQNNMQLK